MTNKEWQGFNPGRYENEIDVADFIRNNYTPYDGDASFLASSTPRTKKIMEKVNALLKAEREKGGVLDVDVENVSSLLGFNPGYIDKENEIIVGLKPHDHFVFLINVSRSEVIDAGYHFRFYIINTIFNFFQQQLSAPSPHLFRTL